MQILFAGLILATGAQADSVALPSTSMSQAPSAQIDAPPSPSKLKLIRRFLVLIGLQHQLDSGSFLDRYAMPGGPLWSVKSGEMLSESLTEGFKARSDALRAAYLKRRGDYQQTYEDHLNWEFTEAELQEIVAFLSKPVGQHYLEGRWRMEAYTNTNTEDMEAEIVEEARSNIRK